MMCHCGLEFDLEATSVCPHCGRYYPDHRAAIAEREAEQRRKEATQHTPGKPYVEPGPATPLGDTSELCLKCYGRLNADGTCGGCGHRAYAD